MTKVAVVLCGSGRFDGSEIHESVLTLLHLDRLGATVQCFAPAGPQWATCDGFSGEPTAETPRDMLNESARIARGDILPLADADAAAFDALVLPGGSGAARNLCSFAEDGSEGVVLPELRSLLRDFHRAGKPIGAICIAPAIVALALREEGIRMTLGPPDADPALRAAGTGHSWQPATAEEIVVDPEHRVVTSPAYIVGPGIAAVERGIGLLTAEVVKMAGAHG
ncbi:MAG: isoprenoid biosynthesis glyoxalase ElbB [Planctomycetota bacterium]|jgi:enhancing lycopene biosynthesis protein 2